MAVAVGRAVLNRAVVVLETFVALANARVAASVVGAGVGAGRNFARLSLISAVAEASAVLAHTVLRAVARADSGSAILSSVSFIAVAVQGNVAHSVSGTALRASSLATVLAHVFVVALAQAINAGSMVRAFVGAGTALASNAGPSIFALALQVHARSLA